ncbi:MAG: hypothetical protein QE263_06790 [Vampirovibrionales bacterium]|nr:hypothetical protein [Vampirovibrionales bacterium]
MMNLHFLKALSAALQALFQASQTASAHKGQGVIEYAGAIVTSALIVSGLVKTAPAAYGELFSNIVSYAQKILYSSF